MSWQQVLHSAWPMAPFLADTPQCAAQVQFSPTLYLLLDFRLESGSPVFSSVSTLPLSPEFDTHRSTSTFFMKGLLHDESEQDQDSSIASQRPFF